MILLVGSGGISRHILRKYSVNFCVCILISDFRDDQDSSGKVIVSGDVSRDGGWTWLTGDGCELVICAQIKEAFSASGPLVGADGGGLEIIMRFILEIINRFSEIRLIHLQLKGKLHLCFPLPLTFMLKYKWCYKRSIYYPLNANQWTLI